MRRQPRPERSGAAALAAAVGASAAAAAIGGIGSRHAPQVYARLDRPRWAPPSEVFAPVWTALYGAMAAAVWRTRRAPNRTQIRALHGSQLVLNAAWPWLFFNRRARPAALAVNVALDATVAAELVAAARSDRTAAVLLAPYLGWSLYATALTAAVKDPGAT